MEHDIAKARKNVLYRNPRAFEDKFMEKNANAVNMDMNANGNGNLVSHFQMTNGT